MSHSALAVPDEFGRAFGPTWAAHSFNDALSDTPILFGYVQTADPCTAFLMPVGDREAADARAELRPTSRTLETAVKPRNGRDRGASSPSRMYGVRQVDR